MNVGTVIHGTLRTQDLLPVLLDELRERDPAAYAQMVMQPFGLIPSYALEDEDSEWWDSEDACWLLEEVIEALDNCAPEGYFFGAHPGDASDFGYWPLEEFT